MRHLFQRMFRPYTGCGFETKTMRNVPSLREAVPTAHVQDAWPALTGRPTSAAHVLCRRWSNPRALKMCRLWVPRPGDGETQPCSTWVVRQVHPQARRSITHCCLPAHLSQTCQNYLCSGQKNPTEQHILYTDLHSSLKTHSWSSLGLRH